MAISIRGLPSTVVFMVFLTCLDTYSAVRIEIDPNEVTAGSSEDVRISCTPNDLPDDALVIVLMRIMKNGDTKPLAFVQRDLNNLQSDNFYKQDVQISGHLDDVLDQSYLNVTLTHPTTQDSGVFSCDVFYVDKDGLLQRGTDAGNLFVERAGVAELEILVKLLMEEVAVLNDTIQTLVERESVGTMMEKITALQRTTQKNTEQIDKLVERDSVANIGKRVDMVEEIVFSQSKRLEECCDGTAAAKGGQMLERVEALEKTARNQSKQIAHITMCNKDSLDNVGHQLGELRTRIEHQTTQIASMVKEANSTSAFSATLEAEHHPTVGGVIPFSDLIMNKGQGYNPKTGVFTAPIDGLYTFHIVTMLNCLDCYVDINLTANDQMIARLSAESGQYSYDQCSVSTVAELKEGDAVKAITSSKTLGAALKASRLSLFSGYLVKAS